jgi:hypothetical protein
MPRLNLRREVSAPVRGRPSPERAEHPSSAIESGWVRWTEAEASREWNARLRAFSDLSPFQSFEMGGYFRLRGWTPAYFVYRDADGVERAMCLCLLRIVTKRTGFVWCVGGPVGEASAWNELPEAMTKAFGLKRLYLRFRCDRPRVESDVLTLGRGGWTPAARPMGANLTMALDLRTEPSALLAKADRNWRRNLRIAESSGLVVGRDRFDDVDALAAVFSEMARAKGLVDSFPSRELTTLIRECPGRCRLYTARDGSGAVVAFHCVLVMGSAAYDYFAATNMRGRELMASYAVMWRVMSDLHLQGVARFDLGGIDPRRNHGVFRFKRGTGAASVELLGEWDWATTSALKWLANAAIALRASMCAYRSLVSRIILAPRAPLPARRKRRDAA